jgi:hypothetical protein
MSWALGIILVLAVVAVIELYRISDMLREIPRIKEILTDIQQDLNELSVGLCGDKQIEEGIKETIQVGAQLTEEQRAYEHGTLVRLNGQLAELIREIYVLIGILRASSK